VLLFAPTNSPAGLLQLAITIANAINGKNFATLIDI